MRIQMFSIHGLVRGTDFELGRDADTGGQVRYVVELARELARDERVEGVDLVTRLIDDDSVDATYSQPVEPLCEKARIIRIPCGDGSYIRKELLWPLLDEFIENVVAFNDEEGIVPDVLHGHYADAGYVARQLADRYHRPFVFTGHSLGRPKLEYLRDQGWSHERANEVLNIDHRIDQEQDSLDVADLVICSTRHERDTQYGEYALNEVPVVIPPGTDLQRFRPANPARPLPKCPLVDDICRFLREPDKPWILTVARPDRRKNLRGLVDAFGQSRELRQRANLVVVAGDRERVTDLPDNEREVFTDILMLQDEYDLYGEMAVPKTHNSETDIPNIFRYVAEHRGVFVNSAFIELFGLTAIEAAACGLPFVAPEAGGPVDIVENCHCGLTVDTTSTETMQEAILRLLDDDGLWEELGTAGRTEVRRVYGWRTHCRRYLNELERLTASISVGPRADRDNEDELEVAGMAH